MFFSLNESKPPRMSWTDKSTSTVVDQVYQKHITNTRSKGALTWAALNLFMAAAVVTEVFYGIILDHFGIRHPVFWYIGICLAVIFILNALVDLVRYLSPIFSTSFVELSEKQKQLLAIKDNEFGIRSTSPSSTNRSHSHQSPIMNRSHSHQSASPIFTHSGSRTISGHSSFTHSPSGGPSLSYSPTSSYSPTMSPYTPSSTYGSRCVSFAPSPNQSSSFSSLNQTGASGGPYTTNSSLFQDLGLDSNNLRPRFNSNTCQRSPVSLEDHVSDLKKLNQFLKEQEEKQQKSQIGKCDGSPSSPQQSMWGYSRSALDYSAMTRPFPYQIACRSPQCPALNDDDLDNSTTYPGDEIWARLDVHAQHVDVWIENLRRYLSQTIMVRVAREIRRINKELRRLGCEDMEIGEVSVATLKQVAITKGQHVRTLNNLIQFLDISNNQEYLVARIQELGKGGCLSDFNWNGGMEYKGRPWAEHLPTDCTIITHAFCTYLDARLPPHPKYPDGRTFTNQHFLKVPDKPVLTRKDNLIIYQSKINPPHFKLIKEDQIWDIPKGRNNMFQAILLFLYHIKNKEAGMMGRVNLGMSGLNILWVLEMKT